MLLAGCDCAGFSALTDPQHCVYFVRKMVQPAAWWGWGGRTTSKRFNGNSAPCAPFVPGLPEQGRHARRFRAFGSLLS